MKFILALVFVANGHVHHTDIPVETMNECVNQKQFVIQEFRHGSKKDHKLLAATCRVNPKQPPARPSTESRAKAS